MVVVMLSPMTCVPTFLLLFLSFVLKCIVVFVGAVLRIFWRQCSNDDKYYEKHYSKCGCGNYCWEHTVIVNEKFQTLSQG